MGEKDIPTLCLICKYNLEEDGCGFDEGYPNFNPDCEEPKLDIFRLAGLLDKIVKGDKVDG